MYNGVKKVCLVGNAHVGKTTYVKRLSDRGYELYGKYEPTIGVEVSQVTIDGTPISVWDLAGNDRLGGLRDGYLIGADVVFVVAKDMDEFYETRKRWWKDHLSHWDPIPVKPLILNPENVDIEDLESCRAPMREILTN